MKKSIERGKKRTLDSGWGGKYKALSEKVNTNTEKIRRYEEKQREEEKKEWIQIGEENSKLSEKGNLY